MNLMGLARKIRDLRYEKGWGPDELAFQAQRFHVPLLYQIERGGTVSKASGSDLEEGFRAPLGVPLESLLAAASTSDEDTTARFERIADVTSVSRAFPTSAGSSDRGDELIEKFRMLLASPLAEGVARIVEESFRLLPIIPASVAANQRRNGVSVEVESLRGGRKQPFKRA